MGLAVLPSWVHQGAKTEINQVQGTLTVNGLLNRIRQAVADLVAPPAPEPEGIPEPVPEEHSTALDGPFSSLQNALTADLTSRHILYHGAGGQVLLRAHAKGMSLDQANQLLEVCDSQGWIYPAVLLLHRSSFQVLLDMGEKTKGRS